jgi:hypothetical protein
MKIVRSLRVSHIVFLLFAAVLPLLAASGAKDALARPTVWVIRADLDAASALPSNSEPATGDVTGTYDASTHILRYNARFLSLTGPATYARFHGPAAFDRVAGATVAAPRPEARLVSGTAWLDKEEEQDLLAGRWYFNVTTARHPQGEIRGMVHATPDPQP